MVNISTTLRYTLTNSLLGPNKALASAPNNDTLIIVDLSSDPSATNQQWYFTATNSTSQYRLHTVQKGDFHAVDVYNYIGLGTIGLHFFSTGDYNGQYWTIGSWSDNTTKLSNEFTGPDIHLEVNKDTYEVKLAGGDNAGQHWTLSAFGASPTPTSAATGKPTVSATATGNPTVTGAPSLCTSAVASCSATASAQHGKSLSKGALAGVAVGGAIGGLALIAIIGLVVKKMLKTPFTEPNHIEAKKSMPMVTPDA
ncbi:hypothetical protein BCR34DRAFT_529983 [Clohesyomyces aquaticus]|uniref:Uncharacterized protein n=1 Tax=Clohesyomyces aquaticus TaxID=1231657 RepID=A0A1Y2A688_9PLEO|nr:hypothetical protein BCR34DRAFT_529983 [Clohesyomyces aquaticus]